MKKWASAYDKRKGFIYEIVHNYETENVINYTPDELEEYDREDMVESHHMKEYTGNDEYEETNSLDVENDNEIEIQYYSSWGEAKKIVPFELSVPETGYDTLISVQKDSAWHIEVLYSVSEQEEIILDYDIFENDNWQIKKDYNGTVLKESTYLNAYGYQFESIQVLLDDDIYTNYILSFDTILIQIQFKNINYDEQEAFLNLLNFKEVLNE